MVLLIVALGCPEPVRGDYEAAKVEALKRAGPAPQDWAPDAVLHLSHDMLGTLLTEVLAHYGTLEDDISAGVATLHPSLDVKKVTLGEGTCENCLGVTANLEGTLGIDSVVDTTAPLVVDATFDAQVTVERTGPRWVLLLEPRELRDLDVTLSGVGLGYAKQPVRQWIDRNFLADVPPQEITTLGGEELPLRAVNVVPRPNAVQIHLLTAVLGSEPVPIVSATPKGWRLDVSPETLTGLAASEAYAAGPLQHDIVPVPNSLALDGDHFRLGIRLWRLSGRGWWRDYEVTGRVKVEQAKFTFHPEEAKKIKSSKGAAFADPIAALGQGVILKAIEQALETTLPATHREDADGLRTRVTAKSLTGSPGLLTAEGGIIVRPVPEKDAKKKRKRRRKTKNKARR